MLQYFNGRSEKGTTVNLPVCSDPKPAIAHVVVDKENVPLLESQLIRVGHLGVRQDCYDPLEQNVHN